MAKSGGRSIALCKRSLGKCYDVIKVIEEGEDRKVQWQIASCVHRGLLVEHDEEWMLKGWHRLCKFPVRGLDDNGFTSCVLVGVSVFVSGWGKCVGTVNSSSNRSRYSPIRRFALSSNSVRLIEIYRESLPLWESLCEWCVGFVLFVR